MLKNKQIPNPSKISKDEYEFVEKVPSSISNVDVIKELERKCKGRMISIPDHFYHRLNKYLRENPTEGNRSSFMVRIVADYLQKKAN